MSIAGFRPRNHPTQVAARGVDRNTDDRATPPDLYAVYHERFRFTLDVAASAHNARTPRFYDLTSNGLLQSWVSDRVWCNPPFSDLGAWVEKAHREFDRGCPAIVMLLPASRTEQGWWQRLVEPHRDRPGGFLRTEFIARRRSFATPDKVYAAGKAPFGLVAVIFEVVK